MMPQRNLHEWGERGSEDLRVSALNPDCMYLAGVHGGSKGKAAASSIRYTLGHSVTLHVTCPYLSN
ncbi:hypothetical protein [Microvirga arabica]|uniref:UspA domain-containing protein n=1 Tax=Microvirga arabica TaxID=1128671 RepID=A0ABV6YE09_9HYPH|nr:hypothetical protein [Microvirga arabica]MBM1175183.1 hypothetical protein [Microvirga arabica]